MLTRSGPSWGRRDAGGRWRCSDPRPHVRRASAPHPHDSDFTSRSGDMVAHVVRSRCKHSGLLGPCFKTGGTVSPFPPRIFGFSATSFFGTFKEGFRPFVFSLVPSVLGTRRAHHAPPAGGQVLNFCLRDPGRTWYADRIGSSGAPCPLSFPLSSPRIILLGIDSLPANPVTGRTRGTPESHPSSTTRL